MLLREVRRGFSEESQFHFQVADTALQFLYPFRFRHSGWKRIPRYSLPVCFNPEPESGIIDTELAGDLGDRQGVIDHLLGGLFLKFRTVPFRFPRHFPVPFRVRSYWIPVRKPGGTSVRPQVSSALRRMHPSHPISVTTTLTPPVSPRHPARRVVLAPAVR